MKHTPGPWQIGEANERKQHVDIDSPVYDPDLGHQSWKGFARVYGCYESPDRGFAKALANARLIAAAPDLYEALELVKAWDIENLALDIPQEIRAKMQAALSKARS